MSENKELPKKDRKEKDSRKDQRMPDSEQKHLAEKRRENEMMMLLAHQRYKRQKQDSCAYNWTPSHCCCKWSLRSGVYTVAFLSGFYAVLQIVFSLIVTAMDMHNSLDIGVLVVDGIRVVLTLFFTCFLLFVAVFVNSLKMLRFWCYIVFPLIVISEIVRIVLLIVASQEEDEVKPRIDPVTGEKKERPLSEKASEAMARIVIGSIVIFLFFIGWLHVYSYYWRKKHIPETLGEDDPNQALYDEDEDFDYDYDDYTYSDEDFSEESMGIGHKGDSGGSDEANVKAEGKKAKEEDSDTIDTDSDSEYSSSVSSSDDSN